MSARRDVEQTVQLAVQVVERANELAIAAIAFAAQLLQLVREVQCSEHGNAIERGHAVVAANLAHFVVEQLRGGHQAVAFVGLAADGVFAIEQADADRFAGLRIHVCCSSDLSRAIIASTRVRACSFLANSVDRSLASCSCCMRRLRFSSLRRRAWAPSSSRRADRFCSSAISWARSMGG